MGIIGETEDPFDVLCKLVGKQGMLISKQEIRIKQLEKRVKQLENEKTNDASGSSNDDRPVSFAGDY